MKVETIDAIVFSLVRSTRPSEFRQASEYSHPAFFASSNRSATCFRSVFPIPDASLRICPIVCGIPGVSRTRSASPRKRSFAFSLQNSSIPFPRG